jgi:hypothetical protein
MIRSIHFHDLLDCLAGQFFNPEIKSALCTSKEFGVEISSAAQEYFSVAIMPEDLPDDRVVLGVLSDDSAQIASRNGYTFTVYIDVKKIEGPAFDLLSSIIIAHEICHFAFYYELFINLGDNTGIRLQNNFKYQVSDKLIDAIVEEQDSTFQTNIDEHNITELIDTFGKYDRKHFTKGSGSLIDYYGFFHDFLGYLNYDEKLEKYKNANNKN